ncbi:transglutaminase-like domain-containing protein [Paludisphaera mucosa]|uniref:Transglutaminase-like domain-containing protein n=1 Tax=Paludisphaera mucosa TaxID=3030827 RepID=A0ABT6FF55_9BACT|nr:transglutaminase-like domain-containing protein [Paludisphaera mucosa]MDG3006201.1 transglutaminase-like domain-containing protein [Paludisphaera mucosa]
MNRIRLRRPCSLILLTTLLAAQGAAARAQDSWDAVFLAGNKIGYIHIFIEKVSEKGRPLNRVRVDTVLSFRRGDDVVTQKMMYGTIETTEGEVLRLDTRTLTSDNEIRVYGDAVKGQMKLILEGTKQRQEQVIPWGPEVRGPYAAEQTMAKKPMAEGESRTLKMYIPDLNRIVDVELKAGANADIELGDGLKRPLRKVEQLATLDGKPRPELNAVLWVDAAGQVLKQDVDLLGGMTTYRTTEQGAKAPGGRIKYDQIRGTIVKSGREIPTPYQTQYVKYQVTLKDEDPAKVIPADRRQSVQSSGDGKSATLVIQSMGPNDGQAATAALGPEFLRPNGMITSADSRVKRLADRAVEKSVDPWDQAVRINHWVFQNMRSNFETTFAPASEAALNLTGDCTEHSVLAAAMSRAKGIPSRVAVGLIYVDNKQMKSKGFGFHMWHEVYVNNRWVALDSSFDQSQVDATHIKLSESSLEGVSPFESFLPILRVQGKVTIDPLELR